MKTNTGKPYERLTLSVFEALLAQQTVPNVRIEHDVLLQGVTNGHQIDVYWEFDAGGITYRTVVECKDWKEPVDQNTLFALHTVLHDLPGQPRGVIVARGGFQEGAKRFAKAHGIVLYELRAPRDDDWAGYVTSINITTELLIPKLRAVNFSPHHEWLEAETKRTGISAESIPPVRGVAGEMRIEREDGTTLTTVGDIMEAHLTPIEVGPPEWREYLFAEPAYIATECPELPRVRLRGLNAQIELIVGATQDIEVRLERLVALILKEVTGNTFRMLDNEGRPLEPGQPRPARILSREDVGTGSTGTTLPPPDPRER